MIVYGVAFLKDILVSIIIRTCGRPQVLAEALESVRVQTYPNIEVVVVEDGENLSEGFLTADFPDLCVRYQCTGERRGRCKAGNLGLEAAKGKYVNFLDDDDLLLPSHVETLVTRMEEAGHMAAYSIAEEHQVRKCKQNQVKGVVKRKLIRYRQPYSRLLLCYLNYIPIQSIMFRRSLYEELGGFDEGLEVLEDWDLWVRYSTRYDFLYIPTVTSIYHTPYKGRQKHQREGYMQKVSQEVLEKHKQYNMSMTAWQVNHEMDYILNVFNKKRFLFYMQKIRNFLLYRDI